MIRYIILILFIISLSSCSSSTLIKAPISDDVFKLAALNEKRIVLEVDSSEVGDRLGTQFVLFLFPFGSARTSPAEYVERTAYEDLTKLGFKPVRSGMPGDNAPKLLLQLKKFDATAYDLLITRRISSTVSILGTLSRGDSVFTWSATGSEGEFRRFGFASDLQPILDRALAQALKEIFQQLLYTGDVHPIQTG